MKKLLTILLVILLPFIVCGQQDIRKQPTPLAKFNDNVKFPLTEKERNQITEVYGSEYANKYIFANTNRLKSIKHYLRNRVVIKKITNKNEQKKCPLLSEINLFNEFVPSLSRDKVFNPDSFNPLKYAFHLHASEAIMVKVDDTDYYIIIKTQHQ